MRASAIVTYRRNVCFYAEMSILRLTVCVMMQNGRNLQ